MPLVSKAFADLITFTRSSTATFVGSNGLTQTAAANVPRFDFDPVTLLPKGLLVEEQRTNLLLRSEELDNGSWSKSGITATADQAISPSGVQNADKIEAATTSQFRYLFQGVTLTQGQTYTLSVFVKASSTSFVWLLGETGGDAIRIFDLSQGVVSGSNGAQGNLAAPKIEPYGNGWFRCSITFTKTTATASEQIGIGVSNTGTLVDVLTGNSVFVWGAQLEAGSFPTSYIPTTTASVTRAGDIATVNTLSPWYRADEGTLYAQVTPQVTSGNRGIMSINNGGQNNQIDMRITSGAYSSIVTSAGATQANIVSAGAAIVGSAAKVALAYKTNDIAMSANGGSPVIDSIAIIPSGLTEMDVGALSQPNLSLNGHIRQIKYFPRRLSDAELQALTAL